MGFHWKQGSSHHKTSTQAVHRCMYNWTQCEWVIPVSVITLSSRFQWLFWPKRTINIKRRHIFCFFVCNKQHTLSRCYQISITAVFSVQVDCLNCCSNTDRMLPQVHVCTHNEYLARRYQPRFYTVGTSLLLRNLFLKSVNLAGID